MAPTTPLEFLPPHLDPRVVAAGRLLLPLWLRRCGIRSVEVEGMERLLAAYERFRRGESRLLLAFRHPSLDDPAVLAQLLWRALPRAGRARGLQWRPAPHAQFLYDRGIPLWAGEGVGWLLQRLGGCSIQRGSLDLPALRTARELLLSGPHPFAVAPEGATNGHSELVSPLEPGVAQLALWTADDLARAGRDEAMELLPIGLQYVFEAPPWQGIERLLAGLEGEAGLPPDPVQRNDPEGLYGRLLALGERELTLLEDFYRSSYGRHLPVTTASPGEDSNGVLSARLGRLLEVALGVVEETFGLEGRGDLSGRCRRLEQVGWERVYGSGREPVCALQRGLAARLAQETETRLWHMRMAESFVAVSGRYVRERPSPERFADTLLLLWATHRRLLGDDPGRRPRLGRRRARVRIGEPMAVGERLADYRQDRRGTVASLTADLQGRLEGLIAPSGAGPGSPPAGRH
ncbi:MAG: hypothetical protein ER33_12315 [Cyanobium sp. CACIAM 14]|nr:MAG: hypothetical protein ER33_12315 [Cyanobium sp. CACIAM 14]